MKIVHKLVVCVVLLFVVSTTTTATTTTASSGNIVNGKNGECIAPVEASKQNCKKDKRSKLTVACDHDLIKTCVKSNLQDCSDVPTASTQACKHTTIKQFLTTKPECYTKTTTQCRAFLSNVDVKPVIPKNCISWFDGCNDCKVRDDKVDDCSKKMCWKKDIAFCKQFQDGKQCRKSRATGKATCEGDDKARDKTATSEEACEDVISNFELSKEEVCKKVLYKCTDNPAVVESCKIQQHQEQVADCSATKDKVKQRSCCVQDKLSGSKCDAYGSSDTLPSDCESRCVAKGKFKSQDKSCRSCRGVGDVRLKDVTDAGKTMNAFDPARVTTTIKEVASGLDKVFVLLLVVKFGYDKL